MIQCSGVEQLQLHKVEVAHLVEVLQNSRQELWSFGKGRWVGYVCFYVFEFKQTSDGYEIMCYLICVEHRVDAGKAVNADKI